jgi:hypothetical protein
VSVRQFPQPNSMARGIVGSCRWCGGADVQKPSVYWHPVCVDAYKAHTDPGHQLELLLTRDGPRCRCCRAGGYRAAGSHVARPAGMGWDEYFKLWRDPEAPGRYTTLGPAIPLEVDHVRPLWSVAHLPDDERRHFFGPTNLQLLCAACHKAKSAREAAERASIRRAA